MRMREKSHWAFRNLTTFRMIKCEEPLAEPQSKNKMRKVAYADTNTLHGLVMNPNNQRL